MTECTNNSKPYIQWDHIDGPLLVTRNGQLHWLTLKERFKLFLGMITAKELDEKYRTE